jgi:hypothetical protein
MMVPKVGPRGDLARGDVLHSPSLNVLLFVFSGALKRLFPTGLDITPFPLLIPQFDWSVPWNTGIQPKCYLAQQSRRPPFKHTLPWKPQLRMSCNRPLSSHGTWGCCMNMGKLQCLNHHSDTSNGTQLTNTIEAVADMSIDTLLKTDIL